MIKTEQTSYDELLKLVIKDHHSIEDIRNMIKHHKKILYCITISYEENLISNLEKLGFTKKRNFERFSEEEYYLSIWILDNRNYI